MNIRPLICLTLFVFMSAATNAQTYIRFTYDLNGNRHTRQLFVIHLKSTNINFPITNVGQLEESKDNLSDINGEQGISVYPNPAGELIKVEFSGTLEDGRAEARLYDLNGNLIKFEKSQSPLFEIDIARLKDGIYILIIKRGSCTSIHKIIKGQGN